MQRLRITQLQQDFVLAKAVHDSRGRILIGAGVHLSEAHIDHLRRRGVKTVYVLGKPIPSEYQSPPEYLKRRMRYIEDAFEGLTKEAIMEDLQRAFKKQALLRYQRELEDEKTYEHIERVSADQSDDNETQP